jgi:hypothetical protein
VQLAARQGRADQALGQVELAKGTTRPYRQTDNEAYSAQFRIDSSIVLQVGENLRGILSRKVLGLMRDSSMDLMTSAEALEAFARLS